MAYKSVQQSRQQVLRAYCPNINTVDLLSKIIQKILYFYFREKTGGITFGDFMEFLSVITKGTSQDKLLWAFTFYDQDKGLCDS